MILCFVGPPGVGAREPEIARQQDGSTVWQPHLEALGLDDSVSVNPSGGALGANVMMATGLVRIIEAASRVADGTATRALAHATNGQALQHNLVCILEGEK